jgi:hypothetical protein
MSAAVSAPLFCGSVGLGPAAQRADRVGILAGFTGAWHGAGALGDPPQAHKGIQGRGLADVVRKRRARARAAQCNCLWPGRLA